MPHEPGLYKQISHDDYHALEYVSNSYLGRLNKCPASSQVASEDTAAMQFGRAFHLCVLEPKLFEPQIAVFPDGIDRRTKDGKAAYADFLESSKGKTVISATDQQTIFNMALSIYNHPFAKTVILEGRSEMTVIWQDKQTGLMCKARPDRIPDGDHGVLLDLKSCTDASPDAFTRSVRKYGYDRQAGMYIEGYNAVCNGKVDAFIFIAVEKSEPYRVECYTLEDTWREFGRSEFHRLLEKELKCRENGYPHYEDAGLQTLYQPNY